MATQNKIRYAVVGLGHIAQTAALPAFKNAKNSELVALVSGDEKKLRTLGRKYKLEHLYHYDDYDDCLQSGKIDAVYIATPNVHHREFAERAARYGIHVLVEKPIATTVEDSLAMLRAAERNDIKMMTAYRLHFDPANLKAIELAQSGKLGDLRIFNSLFSYQLTDLHNIRLQADQGGGPLYDIGVYCINAARYLFRDEPVEAFALSMNSSDERFSEVEEMMTVTLRFPDTKVATFTISFGAVDTATYDVIGTKGCLRLENAYEYSDDMKLMTEINGKEKTYNFKKHDQFGPEIEYFSNCILKDMQPEPSAEEGLIDIKIVEAIFESARIGRPVKLAYFKKMTRPSEALRIRKPARPEPETVHARSPHN